MSISHLLFQALKCDKNLITRHDKSNSLMPHIMTPVIDSFIISESDHITMNYKNQVKKQAGELACL